MALQDGIYEIISALDVNKAVDVYGQDDKSATNIWLYTRNHTAAQKWAVISHGGYYVLVCVLTGRRMDAAGGSMKNGTNVWQYDVNHTHAQHWDIVADGKTLTVDSKSYPTYVIKSDGTSFAVDVTGGSSKPTTNIQLYGANGTDAQRFAFVPVAHFDVEGTYKIVPANDVANCLDVAGGSTASGANIQVYPNNDTSAQRWLLSKNADDSTITLINTHSQKAIDDVGAGTKSGTNAQIYTINGTAAQKFLIEPNGYATYDNQTVQTYRLTVQAGSQLCLDVLGNGHVMGTNVQFYTQNNTQAQQWALIPATAQSDDLPTPAALQSTDDNIGNGKTAANFSFSCNWLNYQMRVRFNTKTAAGWSGWSNWKNAFDGIGGNAGWGPAWQATLTYSKNSDDAKTVSIPIPDEYRVNGSEITALRMQAELRSFGKETFSQNGKKYDYAACSNAAACDVTYYWKPTVKVASAKLCGTGLIIGYTSDLNDGGCDVTVGYGGHTVTAIGRYGGSGEVEIPCDQLIEIPTGTVTCTAKIEHFISSDTTTGQVAVTDSANRKTISMTQEETYYGTHLITLAGVSKNDTTHIYLVSEGTPVTAHIKTQDSTTVYEAVSPLKTKIHALVWVKKAGGTWDDQTIVLKPITDHAYCWTFTGGGCVLDFGTDRVGATQEDSVTRKAEDYEIISRDFHSYRLHRTRERTLTVTGAFVDGVPKHGTIEWLNNLLAAGHATFRNGRGEILPVVVTGISKPINHNGWTEVKVTQYQESR